MPLRPARPRAAATPRLRVTGPCRYRRANAPSIPRVASDKTEVFPDSVAAQTKPADPARPVPTREITVNTPYANTDILEVKEFFRGVEITLAALYFLTVWFAERTSASVRDAPLDKQKIGLVMQKIVTRLGPTFVKLAQTASMRPDLVGDEYAKSLAKLQDAVAPFGDGEAYADIWRPSWGGRSSETLRGAVRVAAGVGVDGAGVPGDAQGGVRGEARRGQDPPAGGVRHDQDGHWAAAVDGGHRAEAGGGHDGTCVCWWTTWAGACWASATSGTRCATRRTSSRRTGRWQFITIPSPLEELCYGPGARLRVGGRQEPEPAGGGRHQHGRAGAEPGADGHPVLAVAAARHRLHARRPALR